MKLSIKKSGRFTYLYAVKGYRDDKGVSTSKVVRKFGTIEELRDKLNGEDPVEWARVQVEEMTALEKAEKQEILVKYKPSVRLKKDEQRSFNGGYLFLQKIYHELELDKVCAKIADRHKFEFDLDGILSRLIYTRIMYPGSKRSSLEESRRYLEQPGNDLHEIYRALSVLSRESDFIQSQVYKNSKKTITRKTGVIYYDCTNYYFESENGGGLSQNGLKRSPPEPIVQMGLFMDLDASARIRHHPGTPRSSSRCVRSNRSSMTTSISPGWSSARMPASRHTITGRPMTRPKGRSSRYSR